MDAAGVAITVTHALAQRGEVFIDVDHVGLDRLRGQRAVAHVVERDPPTTKLLGATDLRPRCRSGERLGDGTWANGTSHVKSTFLSLRFRRRGGGPSPDDDAPDRDAGWIKGGKPAWLRPSGLRTGGTRASGRMDGAKALGLEGVVAERVSW